MSECSTRRRSYQQVRRGVVTLAGLASLVIASCGQPSGSTVRSGTTGAELSTYLAAVEPIRLAVNQLLNGADPVLEGYRTKKLTAAQASAQMGALEETFATYTVDINALEPVDPVLRSINAPYAHTFILEDSYLNALVNGLAGGELSNLPNTQNDQRAAIIEWRVQLEILGQRLHVTLPADLQQAGRGEIAPQVSGS
ncbi:MAG TPA: hypothetical protein VIM76_04700 [Candidatus Dormibacteraeota bacterium]|jgi:hypothetical protein